MSTDAPLASVLAFRVTVTGLSVSDGTNTVAILSQPQDVEFVRLNGLRTLLDLRTVPAGSYNSATITLAAPVISFFDATTAPPSVQTLDGQLVRSSITVQLRQPLVVQGDDLVGLHLDFRLAESLEVNATGQVTGRVDPRIAIGVIPPDAPEAVIDELRGGVVSVNAAGRSFVLQTLAGRTITVVVDDQTQFEAGEGLASLTANSIVQVSGSLQRQNLVLRATEVRVLSSERFLLGGIVTDVRPASGPAAAVDLLVREELPDLPGIQFGRIGTVSFDGNERFGIHDMRLPLLELAFGRAGLVRGQRVSIGGALVTSSGSTTLDARHVILHPQGIEGAWVPGSTNIASGNSGSFALNAFGVTGLIFGGPVRVVTSERTRFIELAGLSALDGTSPIPLRVLGLVLRDPQSGKAFVLAGAVERRRPVQ